jgi:hypothetical protein
MHNLIFQTSEPSKFTGGAPVDSNLPFAVTNVHGQITLRVVSGLGPNPSYGTGAIVANLRNGYKDIGIYVKTLQVPSAVFAPPELVGLNATFTATKDFVSHRRLRVSPPVEEQYTIGHNAAARITLKSDTRSTDTSALSGQTCLVGLNDFRDVESFDQTDLASLGSFPGSAILGGSVSRDNYLFLGPDVISAPAPVDPSLCLSQSTVAVERFEGNTPPVRCMIINFAATVAGTVANPAICTTHQAATIFPYTPVKVHVVCDVGTSGGVLNVFGIFVRAPADPALPLAFHSMLQRVNGVWVNPGTTRAEFLVYDPALYAEGYVLGSVIVLGEDGNAKIYEVRTEYLGLYDPINFGGWRIALWENVGEGQNVSINYEAAVQAVQGRTLSQFSKSRQLGPVVPVSSELWTAYRDAFKTGQLAVVSIGNPSVAVSPERSIQMGMFSDIAAAAVPMLGKYLDRKINMSGKIKRLQMAGMIIPSGVEEVEDDE